MTPEGQEADRIRKWAWEAPAIRVQDAISQIDDIARRAGLSPQALREVQDAGTMLSRLAGTTMAPASISSQLQGS